MTNEVGALVRRLRTKAELTQASLARIADVEPKTISRIETGKQFPSPMVTARLDAALQAGGQLQSAVDRARDDRVGWEAVLGQLDAIRVRLDTMDANAAVLAARLEAGGPLAADIRDWVLSLAAYGEALTERERKAVIGLARQLADKHILASDSD